MIQVKSPYEQFRKSACGEKGLADMKGAFVAAISAPCLAVGSSGAAWSAGEARAPSTYMYVLMVDTIGPAANALWMAAGTSALTDLDWARVKDMTARLTETAKSVSFGGTTARDIERAKSSVWKNWASKYNDALLLAANAVERKDKSAFAAAADDLTESCQGCHLAFPQTAR